MQTPICKRSWGCPLINKEARLGDLYPALGIHKGFPTQRARLAGDVSVWSVAALRAARSPKRFAQRHDLADLRIDLARPGDVLVALEGVTIGESLIVAPGADEFVPSQQVATLRVSDTTVLDPWYLGAWLATDSAQAQLRRLTRRSGVQRIPIKDLGRVILPIPSLQQQRKIGERFGAFETSIQSHRAVTACLEELRAVDLGIAFAHINSNEVREQGSEQ